MHDLDRTQLETGFESYEYGVTPEVGAELYEGGAESGSVLESVFGEFSEANFESYESQESLEAPLSEMMETQLAAELLEITNEDELDHFIGNLIRKATGAIGKISGLPSGLSLGSLLKSVAKKVLPIGATALGTMIGGPAGGALAGKLASTASGLFGLEVAEMSPEDRDFEVARRFVRMSADAAKQTASALPTSNPVATAKAAVVEAARKHAPGLLSSTTVLQPDASGFVASALGGTPATAGTCNCGHSGRHRKGAWFRRGHHIVLTGV